MWSQRHALAACNSCGTSETPHRAHGMCRNCYAKAQGFRWQKAHQSKNRQKMTAYASDWRRANPASVAKSRKKWSSGNSDKMRSYLKTWRRKNRAPFCIVCGEDRAVDWANLIPHCNNGPVAIWNLIPLCPTHHRCYDAGKLHDTEAAVIEPFLSAARVEHNKSK